jgi:hypothetical protein
MVYGVSKELLHKILVHKPYSLKLMDSLQSVMELGIPFAKTFTYRIFMIYLNQVKLEASGWCVDVIHWTDIGSCFSMKILSKGKTHTPNITYDINSKSWDDCVLICEVYITLMHLWVRSNWWSKYPVCWVIAINIVRKLFPRRNLSPLLKW